MPGKLTLWLVILACVQACDAQPASFPTSPPLAGFPSLSPWPACAPHINSPPLFPPGIAPGFPQPPGLMLTKVLTLHADPNDVELVGYVPLALSDAIRWLRERLPQAGYTAVQTDAEPDEVEGAMAGNGWSGNYWVKPEMTCPAVTEWVLIFRKPT